MAKAKKPKLYYFLQSRLFGETIAIFSISIIVLWSMVLIIGASTPKKSQFHPRIGLSVHRYQPAPVSKPIAKTSIQEVLAESTTAQPAPETWQGPIEPLPDDPSHPSVPVLSQIPTAEPVVFLGIDDGWVQTPEAFSWLIQHQLPFSLFLTDNGIKNNYNYFLQLQYAGMTIEDHTVSHPDLPRLNLAQQQAEICGAADTYANVFNARPTLFRPPYGRANQLTLQAAAVCGMRAIIMWHALVQNGAMQYQDGLTHLQPGDIVLMHFTKNFMPDIQAFINQINADNLQVAKLEDWLP